MSDQWVSVADRNLLLPHVQCIRCGAVVFVTENGIDMRKVHEDWHDRIEGEGVQVMVNGL